MTGLLRTASWLRLLAVRYQRAPLVLRLCLAVGWMAWLWWLSAQEQLPDLGGQVGGLVHNAAHLPAYAMLGALLFLLLPATWRHRVPLAIAGAAAYGIVDEIHQTFVPNRVGDVYDVCADTLGAAFACCGLAWLLAADVRCRRALPWLILGAAVVLALGTWRPF